MEQSSPRELMHSALIIQTFRTSDEPHNLQMYCFGGYCVFRNNHERTNWPFSSKVAQFRPTPLAGIAVPFAPNKNLWQDSYIRLQERASLRQDGRAMSRAGLASPLPTEASGC